MRRLRPFPKQEAFVASGHPYSLYAGGYGNGKTYSGAAKCIALAERYPGIRILVMRETLQQIKDTCLDTIFEIRQDLTAGWNKTDKTIRFPMARGLVSRILYLPFAEAWKIEGINAACCWVDQAEAMPRETFDKIEGRLRQQAPPGEPAYPRLFFLTCNPNGPSWIYMAFIKKEGVQDPQAYWPINAATSENTLLPPDYIDRLLRNKPDWWVQRFVYGSWDAFQGQIYTNWSPAVHVVEPFDPPAGWKRFLALDWGERNPCSVGWYAVDYDGNLYRYGEHYTGGHIVSWHAERIKQKDPGLFAGGNRPRVIADPSIFSVHKNPVSGATYRLSDEFRDCGITLSAGENDVKAGINRCAEYLANSIARSECPHCCHRGGRTVGEGKCQHGPGFYVARNCFNFREEIGKYRWKELPMSARGEKALPEEPVDVDDHAMDEWRYAIMSRPYRSERPKVPVAGKGTEAHFLRQVEEQHGLRLKGY